MILISLSFHIVSVTLFSASSAKNASFFLIMNIHLLGKKNANVNLCLFCRLRQDYKVHTYVISMEFFGGKLQTRNAARAGSEEGRLFSQATKLPNPLTELQYHLRLINNMLYDLLIQTF